MKKDIDNKLKELFDYQKFVENPKLKQTIKDTLADSNFKVSELELSSITGGKGNDFVLKKCPECETEDSLLVIISDGKKYEHCLKCNYRSKSNI